MTLWPPSTARRPELCLADRRDRGDGRQGRGRDHLPQGKDAEKIAERTAEYEARFANPFVAASKGFIDEVIMPHSTRRRIALGLRKLRDKQLENPWKKHDNIPL
jgi:acetyl-CoA carboxylase carboxyltransferase component